MAGRGGGRRCHTCRGLPVGRPPTRETLAILTAHWAHETNQGASMYDHNFGGLKGTGRVGPAYSGGRVKVAA